MFLELSKLHNSPDIRKNNRPVFEQCVCKAVRKKIDIKTSFFLQNTISLDSLKLSDISKTPCNHLIFSQCTNETLPLKVWLSTKVGCLSIDDDALGLLMELGDCRYHGMYRNSTGIWMLRYYRPYCIMVQETRIFLVTNPLVNIIV